MGEQFKMVAMHVKATQFIMYTHTHTYIFKEYTVNIYIKILKNMIMFMNIVTNDVAPYWPYHPGSGT